MLYLTTILTRAWMNEHDTQRTHMYATYVQKYSGLATRHDAWRTPAMVFDSPQYDLFER
jgi:hypothetical protein